MSIAEREEIKELVDVLGTNFNVGVFFEHKDTLKSVDAYREAIDGVVHGKHSSSLLRALTHNLITDFKRCKVKTDEYGSIESASDKVRTSNFTLVDAFTALCEASLPKDKCELVEKADAIITGYVQLLATSLNLHDALYSMLAYASDITESFNDDIVKLQTTEEKAKYIRETLSDVIHQMIPTPVSDTGDFADNGAYMCGVYLSDAEDTLNVLHSEEYKAIYWDNFTILNDAITFYKGDCDELLTRAEEYAYENEQFTDEQIVEFADEIIETSRAYVSKYVVTDDTFILGDEEEHQTMADMIGEEVGAYYKSEVVNPIMESVKEYMIFTTNDCVNEFDLDEARAIIMSVISAKLNLHDKMTMALDGNMCVSYDGSAIDEDMHETVSNIYHEKEGEGVSRDVPMADILLDDTHMAEGWVDSVFSIYKAITAHINI